MGESAPLGWLQGAERGRLRAGLGAAWHRQDQHHRHGHQGPAGLRQVRAGHLLHQQRGGQHPGQAGGHGGAHPAARTSPRGACRHQALHARQRPVPPDVGVEPPQPVPERAAGMRITLEMVVHLAPTLVIGWEVWSAPSWMLEAKWQNSLCQRGPPEKRSQENDSDQHIF